MSAAMSWWLYARLKAARSELEQSLRLNPAGDGPAYRLPAYPLRFTRPY
jgi:hypothetical protein